MRAIVLRAHGDAEALKVEPIELAPPGPGEVRVRQTAIGVNFHDIYVRSGLYRTLALPGVPGIEAAGVIEAIGSDVSGWRVGSRVAYVHAGYGAYASHRNIAASLLLRLPDDIHDEVAAALLVRGLTVQVLTRVVHRLRAGEHVLVHAAAGGVGRLLTRAASNLGARVIGTAGSEEKARIARANGCEDTILYREEDFAARVADITAGRGVDVVYDSVGRDTVPGSLRCLAPCAHLVIFGQSSGPIAPIEVPTLAARSLTVSRPILFDYLRDPVRANGMAAELFDSLRTGELMPPAIATLSLEEAGEAHRRLEGRRANEAIVLRP